jgi:hypothetical protein
VKRIFGAAALLAAVALSACGGSAGGTTSAASLTPPTPTKPGPTAHQTAPLKVTVKLPLPGHAASQSSTRRPMYVSQSTQSVVVTAGTSSVVMEMVPNGQGCSGDGVTQPISCTVVESVPVGSYSVTVKAYDEQGGYGNVLSELDNYAFQIQPYIENDLDFVLNGVVASASLSLAASSATIGAADTNYSVAFRDADNNIIVGKGSYQGGPVTLSNSNSNVLSLSNTSFAAPASSDNGTTHCVNPGTATLALGSFGSAPFTCIAPTITTSVSSLSFDGVDTADQSGQYSSTFDQSFTASDGLSYTGTEPWSSLTASVTCDNNVAGVQVQPGPSDGSYVVKPIAPSHCYISVSRFYTGTKIEQDSQVIDVDVHTTNVTIEGHRR